MNKFLTSAIILVATVSSASALSPEKQRQLNTLLSERSVEVLGPRPNSFDGFSQTKHLRQQPYGQKNCVAVKTVHDRQARGTFQRWKCSDGD